MYAFFMPETFVARVHLRLCYLFPSLLCLLVGQGVFGRGDDVPGGHQAHAISSATVRGRSVMTHPPAIACLKGASTVIANHCLPAITLTDRLLLQVDIIETKA